METLRLQTTCNWRNLPRRSAVFRGKDATMGVVALAILMTLAACGGGSSSQSSQAGAPLAGNWQFTMSAPPDASFGGSPAPSQTNCGTSGTAPCPLLLGGFLLQDNGSVNGALTYSITPAAQPPGSFPCSGSASVSGSFDGQKASFTVQAGLQSFNLMGTVSADGKAMSGTYSSIDAQGCGTAQSGVPWSAVSVPVFSGSVQGFLHSRVSHIQFDSNFPVDQNFTVTGVLNQGPNIGATNATVTGTLNFPNEYPCLGTIASVNGQISGNSVVLQIIASDGLDVGQIGSATSAAKLQANPVTVQSTTSGLILEGDRGYSVSSKQCPGAGLPGDFGNICLALGGPNACSQPILISPASLTFSPQLLGSTTSQTITLTNNDPSGTALSGLSLDFNPQSGDTTVFGTPSDFNNLPNFTESDNCAPSLKTPFSLMPGQSCSVTISFSPQQGCPWLPYKVSQNPSAAGSPPTFCPLHSTGKLILTTSATTSTDSDTAFAIPVTGTGLSTITAFPAELDFGSEVPQEKSAPQTITFTNQGIAPVQILPLSNTGCGAPNQVVQLPRPIVPGAASGLQVVENGSGFASLVGNPGLFTVMYACDLDPISNQANFQIWNDGCSGNTLAPQQSCSVNVSFAPQPGTSLVAGLDFFLELNTLQCTSSTSTGCEIDSGRFPVELKANLPSPLRMSPGAGLDFGLLPVGQTADLTITLSNDPNDPNSGTVNFTGNRVKGDYLESDNCGTSLAPGSSCTLTVRFKPGIVGFDPGNIVIGYTIGNIPQFPQTISLRGTGQ